MEELEGIVVDWDHENQCLKGYRFDPKKFRNLEIVRAVLEMAVDHLKFQINMARMQAAQHQAMEARQAMAIRDQLRGRNGGL